MGGDARLGFAVRLSCLYGALCLILGVQLAYLPVWLDWRGLSAQQIAIVSAIPMFIRLILTPTVAFLADRFGHHRLAIVGLAWTTLFTTLAATEAHGFWPLLASVALILLASTTIMPLAETIAMSGVRTAGLDYGRMRLWGSISFIVANFAGGLAVEWQGPAAVLWLLSAAAALTVVAAHLLPRSSNAEAKATPVRLRDALALLWRRDFLVFMIAVGTIQATHAVFYLFGVLHWRKLGIDAVTIGLLWAIAIAVEVLLFAASREVVARVGPLGLMGVGAAAGIVRWSLMALDPALPGLLLLQMSHALTFAATHIGAMHYISTNVASEHAGTAQALVATFTAGVAMGGAMLMAGPLYAHYAGASYLAMSALACAGLAAIVILRGATRPRRMS